MSYTVLARKWRPALFSEIVGQNHVSQTLKNAILSDRIAHGYIFTGPRGVGKTSAARIFSKALNCNNRNNGEPCNSCQSCKEISNGSGMDVIEIDGASNNSVDNIRDLRDSIRFLPTSGEYKIYIIDEVHMLSKGAFNALLKTLEEPPKHAIFIFATTEIHKVLPTILSRCQRFDFKRIPIQEIIQRLAFICQEENVTIDQQSLLQIAKKADGGMRDSQSLLDQMISFCGHTITLNDVNATLGILDDVVYFSFADSFAKHNSKQSLELIDQLFQNGQDLGEVIFGLEEHLRNLLTVVSTGNTEMVDSTDEVKTLYLNQSKLFSEVDILRIVDILQKTEYIVKTGQNPKIKLELAFAKLCQLDMSRTISDIIHEDKKKSPEALIPPNNNKNNRVSAPEHAFADSDSIKINQQKDSEIPNQNTSIPIKETQNNLPTNNEAFGESSIAKQSLNQITTPPENTNENKVEDDINPIDSVTVPSNNLSQHDQNSNQNSVNPDLKQDSALLDDTNPFDSIPLPTDNPIQDQEILDSKAEVSEIEQEAKLVDDTNPFDSIPLPSDSPDQNYLKEQRTPETVDFPRTSLNLNTENNSIPSFTHKEQITTSQDLQQSNEQVNPSFTHAVAPKIENNNTSTIDSEDQSDLHVFKDIWERYIETFRKGKPGLYVNLFHSVPKSIEDNNLIIYFDTTSRGMLNIQSFDRNKEFIMNSFNSFSGKNISISSEQISFEKLGFKKEFNDIHTIVKNLRDENEHFDNLISTLGLDIIDVEETNGF